MGWSQFTSAYKWTGFSLLQPTGGLVSVYFSRQVGWFQFTSADRWVGFSLLQPTGGLVSVYFSRLVSVYFRRQVRWSQPFSGPLCLLQFISYVKELFAGRQFLMLRAVPES